MYDPGVSIACPSPAPAAARAAPAQRRPSSGELRARAQRALQLLHDCHLCLHGCGVDRHAGERGACGLGITSRCYAAYLSLADEPELLPCQLVYLAGCNLRCSFCVQAPEAFEPAAGAPVDIPRLAAELVECWRSGARTVQLVGGEPSLHPHTLLALAAELRAAAPTLPLVLKSNYCMSGVCRELLDGVFPIHVADLKFGPGDCGERLAGSTGYWEQVTCGLRWAAGQGRLIVRHLLMPGHLDCCLAPAARWVRDELPGAGFRLQPGFLPAWEAAAVGLGRPVAVAELRAAGALLAELGLAGAHQETP